MKEMTLTEQLRAVNLADEASQLSLLENCSNLHFITLSFLSAGGSIKVYIKILQMEELHIFVLKTLEVTVPEYLKKLVRNHVSYKRLGADKLKYSDLLVYHIKGCEAGNYYKPVHRVESPVWQAEFRLRSNDADWLMKIAYSRSVPHVCYLIENAKLTKEVINAILVSFADKDCDGFDSNRFLVYVNLARHQVLNEENEAILCCLAALKYIELRDLRYFFKIDGSMLPDFQLLLINFAEKML